MKWISKLFGSNYSSEGYLTSLDIAKARESWEWVEDQIKLGKLNSLKLAIIEADKIIDQILRVIYPSQPNMADRLKLAQPKFNNRQTYEDLWYCHKVRNLIAHEVSYDLQSVEALNILEKYRLALVALGVL